MVVVGIVLLLVGLGVAWLASESANPEVKRFVKLGFIVAGIGVVAIVLGLVLDIAETDDGRWNFLLLPPGLRLLLGSRTLR